MALSEVLKDNDLIEKGNQSQIARAFCNEFNIPVDIQSFKLSANYRRKIQEHKHLFKNFKSGKLIQINPLYYPGLSNKKSIS